MFATETTGFWIGDIACGGKKMVGSCFRSQKKYIYDGCVINIDGASLAEARKLAPESTVLMVNIDSSYSLVHGIPEEVRIKTREISTYWRGLLRNVTQYEAKSMVVMVDAAKKSVLMNI